MIRQAPEIMHLVQAAFVGREVRDAAALFSHGPTLLARLHVQDIHFSAMKLLSHKDLKITIIFHVCPQPKRKARQEP